MFPNTRKKNSRDIFRYICKFLRHFKVFMLLFHYFSWNSQRSVEPCLKNSVVDHTITATAPATQLTSSVSQVH